MDSDPSARATPFALTRLVRATVVAACALAFPLLAVPAGAQPTAADRETARRLMQQGDALLRAADFQGAYDAYRAANRIMAVPTTGLALAKAEEGLGKVVEAEAHASEVARSQRQPGEPGAFAKAREQAREVAERAAKRIAWLRLAVDGAAKGTAVRVDLDGNSLAPGEVATPQRVNPGRHGVRAVAPAHREAAQEVVLGDGETRSLLLVLVPDAAPPPAPTAAPVAGPKPAPPDGADAAGGATRKSPLVWIGFGVGGAGLLAGSVTGLLAFSRASEAKSKCAGNECPPSAQDDIDATHTLGTVSNISFAVGIAGVGLGVYGLLRPPRAAASSGGSSSPPVVPWIGAGQAGLAGRF